LTTLSLRQQYNSNSPEMAAVDQICPQDSEMPECAELPQELWNRILQHADYKQRLSACALVCQKLAKAAAAATKELTIQCDSPQRQAAFLRWVDNNGSSLTRLSLASDPNADSIRQLPCANLLELEVSRGSAQLCGRSEGLGLLHSTHTACTPKLRSGDRYEGWGSCGGSTSSSRGAAAQLEACCFSAFKAADQAYCAGTATAPDVPDIIGVLWSVQRPCEFRIHTPCQQHNQLAAADAADVFRILQGHM
jgi:hypothetical protein